MESFLKKLKLIFTDREILGRLAFVVVALVVFRLLAAIPIPGIDPSRLEQFFSNNQFLGLLNIFSRAAGSRIFLS